MLLALVPIVLVVVALGLRMPPTRAAILGLVAVAIAIPVGFPTDPGQLTRDLIGWLPTLVEVLLILAGGILLARLLDASGAQSRIATWLGTIVVTPTAAVLFVVHGAVPFAESVTGFGVGVMVGVPLLLHLGRRPVRAAVLAMLGLVAVPWGALGPGTLIAARLNDLELTEFGVATALVNGIVFLLSGPAAVILDETRTTARRLAAGLASGALLWAGVLVANLLVGTPLAGVLGSLVVIGWHLVAAQLRARTSSATRSTETRSTETRSTETRSTETRSTETRNTAHAADTAYAAPYAPEPAGPSHAPWRALVPYAVLVIGLLSSSAIVAIPTIRDTPANGLLDSPALWLAIACATAATILPFERGIRAQATKNAAVIWQRVGLPTGGFLLLGVVMALAGMSAALAQAAGDLGRGYLALAPWIGGLGGFMTGSNAGSNSMFAAAQGETAAHLGVSVILLVAMQNAAASALTMASPSRVEMAIGLCPRGDQPDRRTVMATVLAVNAVMLAGFSILALMTL